MSNVCASPDKKRGRRRSFKPTTMSLTDSQYLSGKRIGPKEMQFPENDEKSFMFGDRERDNFLWPLLRHHSLPMQVVPSWTGFNIDIQEEMPILKSSIYYLDFIDAPATEISTIYQVFYFFVVDSLGLCVLFSIFLYSYYIVYSRTSITRTSYNLNKCLWCHACTSYGGSTEWLKVIDWIQSAQISKKLDERNKCET